MEMMTLEEFKELKNGVDKAQEDTTPYMGVIDEEIHVMGDANKTELVPHTYTLKFGFPKTDEWRNHLKESKDFRIEKETENFIVAYRTYKNVWVTPRKVTGCIEAFTRLISFMKIVNEKGEIEDLTEEQMLSMLTYMNKEVEDACYRAVQRVIGLSEEEAEFITIDSAMFNATKIVNDHPDIINTSDLFFG